MLKKNNNSYIVDCNVVVKWFLPEEHSEEALMLLDKSTKNELILHAPEIISLEFAGVLTRYNKLKLLTTQECKKYFDNFIKIINQNILNISLSGKQAEVLDLALQEMILYNDAEYLYLAKKLNLELITYDKQLKKIANRHCR